MFEVAFAIILTHATRSSDWKPLQKPKGNTQEDSVIMSSTGIENEVLTSAGPILALKSGKTLLKDSKLFDERLKGV